MTDKWDIQIYLYRLLFVNINTKHTLKYHNYVTDWNIDIQTDFSCTNCQPNKVMKSDGGFFWGGNGQYSYMAQVLYSVPINFVLNKQQWHNGNIFYGDIQHKSNINYYMYNILCMYVCMYVCIYIYIYIYIYKITFKQSYYFHGLFYNSSKINQSNMIKNIVQDGCYF
jgi:hypothetical protein